MSGVVNGVPRRATGLDELRVGQVVAWSENDEWFVGEVGDQTAYPSEWQWTGTEVILSDPPPEPTVLSSKARAAFEELERCVTDARHEFATRGEPGSLLWLAGALVDEVNR